MSAIIKTFADLEAEKLRLQLVLAYQAGLIRGDIEVIKEDLKPFKSMAGVLGKVIYNDRQNPLINLGVGIVGDVLIKSLMFGRTGVISKLAPFLLKNISARLFPNSGEKILHTLGGKIHRLKEVFTRISS